MDFGNILDKWEQTQSGVGKGGNASSESIMEEWLKNNRVYDKDAEETISPDPGRNRRRLHRMSPDDILDIHGFTSEKALSLLNSFFSNAKDCSYEKIRIIHGKGKHSQGEAVLSAVVRRFIEQCPFAGESGYEKAANGGTGATWVFLKSV